VYGAQARPSVEYLGEGARVVVDAELDWREWTDLENNRREAVTLKARQVLFESARRGNGRGEGGKSITTRHRGGGGGRER
jgi:single-stranded DNA-binding protein